MTMLPHSAGQNPSMKKPMPNFCATQAVSSSMAALITSRNRPKVISTRQKDSAWVNGDDGVHHPHDGRHPEQDQDILLIGLGNHPDTRDEPDGGCSGDRSHHESQKGSHTSTVPADP